MLVNSHTKSHRPRVYNLNKGEVIVDALTFHQKACIYSLFFRVAHKKNIFYSCGMMPSQTMVLTSEEKDAMRGLPKAILDFIFGDYKYR